MNFTESYESVSELSYVICPYLFKRRNESNNFSQDQAERISTSSKHSTRTAHWSFDFDCRTGFRDRLDRVWTKYAGDRGLLGQTAREM